MVKSRKYAIVTAALALILVAAVVLTVVLVGNGSFYTPEQDGIASNAAVTVNSTTGTVPNRTQYIFETLTENSAIGSRGNGWQASDRNEEGIFVTTLNSKFYLLSNYTWDELIANKISGVGNGYYEMIYNGATYRFKNGNSGLSGDMNSLFRTFTMFMTYSSFYQDVDVYGLIFTESVSYNPDDTFDRSWFDATLDGAGATISPTAVLNVNDNYSGSGAWPHQGGAGRPYPSGVAYVSNGYLTSNESQLNRNTGGTGFVGLLFGGLRKGTFMNFQWSDAGISGTHSYTLNTEQYGTAFGGLTPVVTHHGLAVHAVDFGRGPPFFIEVEEMIPHLKVLITEKHVNHAAALRLIGDPEVPIPQSGVDCPAGKQLGHMRTVTMNIVDGDLDSSVGIGNNFHIFNKISILNNQSIQLLAAVQEDGPVLGGQKDLFGGVVQPGQL